MEDSGMGGGNSNDQKPLDWAKKVLALGVGAAFLTEEGIRGLMTEFKLPKELVGVFLEGASKVRKDFLSSFSQDLMSKISDKIDPQAVISEFLKKNEVTLEIKIKVKDKDEAKQPPKHPETLV